MEIENSGLEQNQNKKKIIYGVISAVCLFLVIFLIFIFSFFSFDVNKGKTYYKQGQYQKAVKYYYKAINFKKMCFCISSLLNLKSQDNIFDEINNLLDEIAFCYFESGDLKKALKYYDSLYEKLYKNSNYNSHNEALLNHVKLKIALSYSNLGYYDKAMPLLKDLQNWYPQNLIIAYINNANFVEARNLLFSEEIQDKIQKGDDMDAAYLNYCLWEYYKATFQYDKVLSDFNKPSKGFEYELMKKISYADLYFLAGYFMQSSQLYESLIKNKDFPQKTKNKIIIRYAIVLSLMGKSSDAKNLFNQVIDNLKDSYKLSPDIICTKYYLNKYLEYNDEEKQKEVKNMFSSLKLTKDSVFYGNIDSFCKVNMQY